MTDPYRDSARDVPSEAPRDAGIVGDVIAQFADPKAFFRELVQNSIDAGSPAIEIKLEYDEPAQRMRASVRDRGEGMTREIIENQLLVLFRSTKEQDRTKIGKFGIGFSSVLAPNPEVVIVQTSRDGRRLTLHLYRDLSYDLFDSGPATQAGTVVELEIALARDEVDTFVRDSERSIVRWCRHAAVPIELSVHVGGDVRTNRIDRPVAFDEAIVEVRRTADDGQLLVVVAMTAAAMPYVGFFNHGLMLYETNKPLLGALSVKIQDARLGHTISRDDVRRDEYFDRALEVAQELVRHELPQAAETALRDAAERADLERHGLLARTIVSAKLGLSRHAWHLPLVHPIGGKSTTVVGNLVDGAWASMRATELTEALAADAVPVVLAPRFEETAALLYEACDLTVRDVHVELTAIAPIDPTDEDLVLLRTLHEVLDDVHRPPLSIVIAKLAGARDHVLSLAGRSSMRTHLVDREEAARDPMAFLRRRVLVLSAEHPHVRAARRAHPVLASSHLARAVLLKHGLLTADRSRKIVEHALERVGGGE